MLKFSIMYKNILTFFFAILLSSCISNKDLDIFSSKNATTFETKDYEKKFRTGDLLSVQIHSSTASEYDLFNKKPPNVSQTFNPYLEGFILNDSGNIQLPLIGSVYLLDKTLLEAENIIADLSKSFLKNPTVKVNLLNFEINVLGEVYNSGRFSVQKPKINVLDAISLAGGFNSDANRKKVKLIRFNEDKSKILYLDLSDPSIASKNNFYLESNDVIFVLPVKKRFLVINNLSSAISIVLSTISLYLLISQTN